jgi:hypothetical protein
MLKEFEKNLDGDAQPQERGLLDRLHDVLGGE